MTTPLATTAEVITSESNEVPVAVITTPPDARATFSTSTSTTTPSLKSLAITPSSTTPATIAITIVYTREEVREATLCYFNGDELATDVWMNKYALKDESDRFVERTPFDTQRRLAREFHRIEQRYPNSMSYDEISSLLDRGRLVIPQGSPMSAVGNPYSLQSTANCFVVGSVIDSYGGILRTDQEIAQIAKARGGSGVDVSAIRPRGARVSNAARTTAGLGVYLERFSNTMREVGQDGRRGALMLTCSCRHPEIMTFIDIKRDLSKVTGANISIRWTDDFLEAVERDEEYVLRWPCDASLSDARITKTIRAREIWDAFIDSTWTCAEPGALFWDTVLRESISDCYRDDGFESVGVNPCAEIILSAYDACRLMVVNLMGCVKNPYAFNAAFDYHAFNHAIGRAQRLLDDLVDLEIEAIDRIIDKVKSDPEPEDVKAVELNLWRRVRDANVRGRRTGLGITALGDCIAALGMKYGTLESIEFTEQVYKNLAVMSEHENTMLAMERGAFPVWDAGKERGNPYLARVHAEDPSIVSRYRQYGRRSISTTTTAPVGSTSMQALVFEDGDTHVYGTTSGIEPVAVALKTTRRRKLVTASDEDRVDFVDAKGDKWQEYDIFHPGVRAWMHVTGETDETKSPYSGATSRDIDWETSVELQARAQKWISHAISKTANLPADVSKETVSRCYMKAWTSRCKGFTIYREGCRSGVIVDAKTTTTTTVNTDAHAGMNGNERGEPGIRLHHAPKRPLELPCDIHQTSVRGQKWIVLIGTLQERPYEVFAGLADKVELPKKAKSGRLLKHPKKRNGESVYDLTISLGEGDDLTIHDVVTQFDNPTEGAFTRAISLSLRHGVPPQFVVEQLLRDKKSDVTSFGAALSRVLKKYVVDGTMAASVKSCTQCGASPLVYQEGCITCKACGWSKCH